MKEFVHLNGLYLSYLTPLLKWRVLNLESLRRECFNEPEYFNFCKIIRSLEKAKVLEAYRHPFNRKKYVYLSALGEDKLSLKENPSAISKDTLIHDIKVSEMAKRFVELGWADNVELEHQLSDKRNFRATYKIIPDALLEIKKNGVDYKIALEVELSRKNNQRIIEKARQYAASTYYNHVFFYFSRREVMNQYLSVLSETLGEAGLVKFMFFYEQNGSDLLKITGIFKGKEIKLANIFNDASRS